MKRYVVYLTDGSAKIVVGCSVLDACMKASIDFEREVIRYVETGFMI